METAPPPPALPDWKRALAAELKRVGGLRLGPALMAVGWAHLAFFLACQIAYSAGVRAKWFSILMWLSEVAAVLLTVRFVAGKAWLRESSVVQLIVRIWGTFLILSFNTASLNTLIGLERSDWFKPAWCTLGSFGFATMAWLFGPRYLVPAFQMYFTGLLMVALPEWNYLIHGLSWCAALQWVGWDLIQRRRLAAPVVRLPLRVRAPREPRPLPPDHFRPQIVRLTLE